MTEQDCIQIGLIFRTQNGVEAYGRADLYPASEEPDYHWQDLPREEQRAAVAEAMTALEGPEENELSVHLFWAGEEQEGFGDCHPLPDGSEVFIFEAAGDWDIYSPDAADTIINTTEGACKRLSVLQYEVVGAPRDAEEMLVDLTGRAEMILADADDQDAGNIEAACAWLLATDEERQQAVQQELAGWEAAEERAEAERSH